MKDRGNPPKPLPRGRPPTLPSPVSTGERVAYASPMPDPAAPATPQTSRGRYTKYRQSVRDRVNSKDKDAKKTHVDWMGQTKSTKRTRPFFALFREFFQTLRGHRGTMAAALCTVSVSTLLGLVPLYGTKLVFDNVLRDQPLPPAGRRWLHLPTEPRQLLAVVGAGMIALTVVSDRRSSMWGRWQTTRMTKRVQVGCPQARLRPRRPAAAAPRVRAQERRRRVDPPRGRRRRRRADLLDALQPGRARSSSSWAAWSILAFVDWRLLLGSLVLLPTVWLTHRTWIGRIRPIFRDIRNTRQGIDSHATEAFGGMRVVRAFSPPAGRGRHVHRATTTSWPARRCSPGGGCAASTSRGRVLIPLACALLLYSAATRVLTDMDKLQAGLHPPGRRR